MMNSTVIEAAMNAFAKATDAGKPARERMALTIHAADLARAEDVKAAVERFEIAVLANHIAQRRGGPDDVRLCRDELDAARRDLFALLGIPEDGA